MPLWPQVEWPAEKMAWADFRGKLLGPTDPASAPEGSLRKEIYSKWSELGILMEMDRVDQRDLVSSGLSEFVEYRNCQTSPGRNKHITVGAGCGNLFLGRLKHFVRGVPSCCDIKCFLMQSRRSQCPFKLRVCAFNYLL